MIRRLLVFLALAVPAFAANGLVTGALTLSQTFYTISVQAAYTGDDNANATCTIDYSVDAGANWRPCYVNANTIDRRATLTGLATNANPYVKTARTVVVGLSANTLYSVRITWADADGVTGTNPVSSTITTLTKTPPLGGSTTIVNNDGELTTALAAVVAGGTIHMNAGTYSTARTLTTSGNAGAWIKIEGAGATTVWGSGNACVTVNADYIWIASVAIPQNSTAVAQAAQYGIYCGATTDHVLIDTVTFSNVGGAGGLYNPNYGTSGIGMAVGANNIYAISCSFNTANPATTYNESYVFGFSVPAAPGQTGGYVLDLCTFTGNWRDAVSSEGNTFGDGFTNNCAVSNCTVASGFYDDGMEFDGDDRNLAVWGNTVACGTGNDCISFSGVNVGPAFAFRNYLSNTNGGPIFKMGNGDPGPANIFHNTGVVTVAGANIGPDGLSELAGAPFSELLTARNNLWSTWRYPLYRGGRSNTYDYNLYYPNPAGNNYSVSEWNTTTNYQTVALFFAGTGQEQHGQQGNPNLNSDGTLQSGSLLAIDTGVAIANFNGANTAWPISGVAPDIGAYEYIPAVGAGGSALTGKATLSGTAKVQ